MSEFRPPVRPSKVRAAIAVILPLVMMIPLGGLALMLLGMSAASYAIADGALTVHSGDLLSGSRTIPLSDVTEVRAVPLVGGWRVAGTALPGYCAGRFHYSNLGTVWQVTTCSSAGLLIRSRSDTQPVVISPPDPVVFADSLHAGTALRVTLPPPDAGPLRTVAFVVLPLVFFTLLMLPVLLLLGPRRMRYVVKDGRLLVETIFGHQSWPTAGARARPYTPGKMMRVGGTAAPGYYTGRYRESGQGTRVYATDLKAMVLFEGEARVLVSPEDRAAFLRALTKEGAVVEPERG
jgi:hypothetical protein